MSQANFLNANQVLLKYSRDKSGREYVGESIIANCDYREASWFLGDIDADVFQILRFDRGAALSEDNADKAVSDVTEELAEAYLYEYDNDDDRGPVELDSEAKFPAYVAESKAWARWKDDLEAELPAFDPDMARVERRELQMEGA